MESISDQSQESFINQSNNSAPKDKTQLDQHKALNPKLTQEPLKPLKSSLKNSNPPNKNTSSSFTNPKKPNHKSPKRSNSPKKNSSNSKPHKSDPNTVLIQMLTVMLELQDLIDKAKKKLITCPDFNTSFLLKIFDQNNLGFTTESDFIEGLEILRIPNTKEEIQLIFYHYSRTYNKRMTNSELLTLFLPYLERNNFGKSKEFHIETLEILRELLEKHIQHEVIMEKYRQLWKRQRHRPEVVFRVFGKDPVGQEEVNKVLYRVRDVSYRDTCWIFQYFDKSPDETLSLKEFSKEYLPKCFKRL